MLLSQLRKRCFFESCTHSWVYVLSPTAFFFIYIEFCQLKLTIPLILCPQNPHKSFYFPYFCYDKCHEQKKPKVERFIQLTLTRSPFIERNQSSCSSGNRNRNHRDMILAGMFSLAHAQDTFLYKPGPPDQGWCCSQWAGTSHIKQQSKKMPRHSDKDSSNGQFGEQLKRTVEGPSSHMNLICDKIYLVMTLMFNAVSLLSSTRKEWD